MLRCAAFFVVEAYPKVRLTLQNLRVLPANFLQNRLKIGLLREHQVIMVQNTGENDLKEAASHEVIKKYPARFF